MDVIYRDTELPLANTYYRISVIVRTLEELGLADCYAHDDTRFHSEEQLALKIAQTALADMYLQYQSGGAPVEAFQKAVQRAGDVAYFVTMDDDIHYASPLNPRYQFLGWKAPDGRTLRKGETIWFHDEKTGERWPIWKDGENNFDISRNKRGMKSFERVLKRADGVIVTSDRLKQAYEERLGLTNIYTFPNSMIPEDYPRISLAKQPGVVRVLWQGGSSHYEDWYSAKDTIADAIRAFPETRLVVWGSFWKGVHGLVPPEQLEHHEVVAYEAFKIKLAAMDFDINIAPLADSIFNRGKSCIKFYEASILPEPKPTLAANVPPYSDEIVDDETGFLYSSPEEFRQKFEALVRFPKLRLRLARNAQKWVLANRAASVTVPKLWDWMVKKREARRGQSAVHRKRKRASSRTFKSGT